MEPVICPYEDTLDIIAEIDGYDVKRVLLDSGIAMDVLFLDTLKKMGKTKKRLEEGELPTVNFPQTQPARLRLSL